MAEFVEFKPKALPREIARKIAAEVDPAAGGFFRACLMKAAQLGAEYALQRRDDPNKTDSTPLPSPENSLP